MSIPPPPAAPPPDHRWDDLARVEEWAGELRVNVIRLAGIVLFYARHLVEFATASPGAKVRGPYHLRATVITALWAIIALLLHAHLRRRRALPSAKFLVTAGDLLMITLLCMNAGGPQTPLLLLLFLVIAASPLRANLQLVYAATAGAIASYLCLLAFYAWFVIGFHKYYASPELRIPRTTEAFYILALLLAGFLAGQAVRQLRRAVAGHHATVLPPGEDHP